MSSSRIDQFLQLRRIAVVGVRRRGASEPGNAIYKKLKSAGYTVYAVNPHLSFLEGDRCFRSLTDIPDKPDGVVITTHPKRSLSLADEAVRIGIQHVWFHRSFGDGSVSDAAVSFCREHDVEPIVGGCPMMFVAPVDVGHRCIRWMLKVSKKLPA
ncbi:MAG: CoA-binding protein [Bacteroidetes bacterium]|nr:CoA-binding protein [Bacteroidota bacterium]